MQKKHDATEDWDNFKQDNSRITCDYQFFDKEQPSPTDDNSYDLQFSFLEEHQDTYIYEEIQGTEMTYVLCEFEESQKIRKQYEASYVIRLEELQRQGAALEGLGDKLDRQIRLLKDQEKTLDKEAIQTYRAVIRLFEELQRHRANIIQLYEEVKAHEKCYGKPINIKEYCAQRMLASDEVVPSFIAQIEDVEQTISDFMSALIELIPGPNVSQPEPSKYSLIREIGKLTTESPESYKMLLKMLRTSQYILPIYPLLGSTDKLTTESREIHEELLNMVKTLHNNLPVNPFFIGKLTTESREIRRKLHNLLKTSYEPVNSYKITPIEKKEEEIKPEMEVSVSIDSVLFFLPEVILHDNSIKTSSDKSQNGKGEKKAFSYQSVPQVFLHNNSTGTSSSTSQNGKGEKKAFSYQSVPQIFLHNNSTGTSSSTSQNDKGEQKAFSHQFFPPVVLPTEEIASGNTKPNNQESENCLVEVYSISGR